jgi:hypothetical protein
MDLHDVMWQEKRRPEIYGASFIQQLAQNVLRIKKSFEIAVIIFNIC